jgi:hypothetical protein
MTKIKLSLVGLVCLPTFVLISYFYGQGFFELFEVLNFDKYLNLHDHDVYLKNIDLVKNGEALIEFANDKGIASIYLMLSYTFPFLASEDMKVMAFFFNTIIMVLCYVVYSKIADDLGLGGLGRLSFFIHLSFLYFSQLINKDMLTILYFLMAVRLGMQGRYWVLLLLLPFFVFVRLQLVVFTFILIFFSMGRKFWWKMAVAYIASSMLAGYLSVYHSIIGDESLGGGFNAFVIDLNKSYLIGYVLFNPIRLFQYGVDAYLSFFIFTEDGSVDVAKVMRIPVLILFLYLAPAFVRLIANLNKYIKSPLRPLILVGFAYALTWLMSPIVNARYVMLITPVMLLALLFVKARGFNDAKK